MKNKTKKKNAAGIIVTLLCSTLILSGCSEPVKQDETKPAGTFETARQQAEIQYYQEQITLLQTQLAQMDAKIVGLKDEYVERMEKMQENLDLIRQSTEQIPTASQNDDATNDGEQAKYPATRNEEQDGNEEQPGEEKKHEHLKETALYTYREENGEIMIVRYVGAEREVTIPAGINGKPVTGIGESAFANTEVCSVIVPETVKSLGWFTFFGCSSLRSVSLPASVQSIGYASFDGCNKNLTLQVRENSYAQKFAASFALHYEIS